MEAAKASGDKAVTQFVELARMTLSGGFFFLVGLQIGGLPGSGAPLQPGTGVAVGGGPTRAAPQNQRQPLSGLPLPEPAPCEPFVRPLAARP